MGNALKRSMPFVGLPLFCVEARVGEKGSSSIGFSGDELGCRAKGDLIGGVKSIGVVDLILGMTIVKSSAALVGLMFIGLSTGWRFLLKVPILLGEGFLIAALFAGLPICLVECLKLLVAGAGVLTLFAGLGAGLRGGVSALIGFLFEYESAAVAGLTISILRRGRTGAEESVPTEVLDTFRDAVDMAVAGLPRLDCDMDFFGVPNSSADPGREGISLPAALAALAAFFWAAMVSLNDGFDFGGIEPVL